MIFVLVDTVVATILLCYPQFLFIAKGRWNIFFVYRKIVCRVFFDRPFRCMFSNFLLLAARFTKQILLHSMIIKTDLLGGLEVDDASEFLGIKGGSSDQASIDFGHGHELIDTIGCDRTSVLDSGGLGNFIIVNLCQDSSQKGVCVVYVEGIVKVFVVESR